MKGVIAGCTCCLAVILLLICQLLLNPGVLSSKDTGNRDFTNEDVIVQEHNRSLNNSSENENVKETTIGSQVQEKPLNEDDLVHDLIQPTVAPATPHDELNTLQSTATIDGAPDTFTPENTPAAPKRSLLHAFDITKSSSQAGSLEIDPASLKSIRLKIVNTVLIKDASELKTNSYKEEESVAVLSPSFISPSVSEVENLTTTPIQDMKETNQNIPHDSKIENANKGESSDVNFETFEEWREKQKIINQDLETVATSKGVTRKQVKKKNYASSDCSAKVVAANAEASNLAAMLNENKDIYMLSPCQSKIWFIVELCERIQVESIDIVNYELFSSTPKSFNVYVGNRHPSRDWQILGTFHAREERQIQSFPLEEKHYAKFVKVEMLSHFGSEHYCPISLFRVFGTSEVDELEESENTEADHDGSYTDNHEQVLPSDPKKHPKDEDSQNFIKSAKDAVIDMVSKAVETLTKNSGNNVTQDHSEADKKKMVTPLENQVNLAEPARVNSGNTVLHSSDATTNSEANSSIIELIKDEAEEESSESHPVNVSVCLYTGDLPNRTCTNPLTSPFFCFVLAKKQCPFLSIWSTSRKRLSGMKSVAIMHTVGVVSEQRNGNKDSTMSVGSSEFIALSKHTPIELTITKTGTLSDTSGPITTSFQQGKTEVKDTVITSAASDVIVEEEHSIPHQTVNDIQTRRDVSDATAINSASDIVEPSVPPSLLTMSSQSSSETPNVPATVEDIAATEVLTNSVTETKSKTQLNESVDSGVDVDVLEFKGFENNDREGRAEIITPNGVVNKTDSQVSASSSSMLDPAHVASGPESIVDLSSLEDTDTNKVDINSKQEKKEEFPSKHQSSLESTDSQSLLEQKKRHEGIENGQSYFKAESPGADVVHIEAIAPSPTVVLPEAVSTVSISSTENTVLVPSVTSTTPNTGLPKVQDFSFLVSPTKSLSECTSVEQAMTVATGAAGGSKESMLVKLKGRVKALEANLTLSTQYLKEMSRRYKTAMEDQRKTFEKNILDLNLSLSTAEAKLAEHEKRTEELVKTITLLKEQIEVLSESVKRQNKQISENYTFLVVIQVFVTASLLWMCRQKRSPQTQTPSRIEHRRNSEPDLRPGYPGDLELMHLQGQNGLTSDHTIKEQLSPIRSLLPLGVGTKKKRLKRKAKSVDGTAGLGSNVASSTIVSRTAGLLFSAGKGIFYGIAGALTPSYSGKRPISSSRNTRALVDDDRGAFAHTVRRSRSSELSVIQEDDMYDIPPRPKSCDDIFLAREQEPKTRLPAWIKRSGKQSG